MIFNIMSLWKEGNPWYMYHNFVGYILFPILNYFLIVTVGAKTRSCILTWGQILIQVVVLIFCSVLNLFDHPFNTLFQNLALGCEELDRVTILNRVLCSS
uniref:Uncharacterized protein n=1 Tax=Cacopsylla melanoneura TaxID=428564 RepID=A0A8D8ZPW1_9HEMI